MKIEAAFTPLAVTLLALAGLMSASFSTETQADQITTKTQAQSKKLPPKIKMVDAWLINQKTELLGDELLLVSPIGVKASNPKSAITLLMTPPFETVTVYNERAGTIFQSSLKTFRCPMLRTFVLFSNYILGDVRMIKESTGNIGAFKTVKYHSTKEYESNQLRLRLERKIPSGNPRIIVSQSTDDFHLANGAGEALCKLYGLPVVPGIPLQVDSKNNDLLPSVLLKSTQFTRTKVDEMDFILPQKYKKLQSIEEITKSNVTEDEMQLFGK